MPLPQTPLIIQNPYGSSPVLLHSRVLLAPMAGVTDIVFRGLVRQFSPNSLICTEMISSNGLYYSKRWDATILDRKQEEAPIAYQLAAHRLEVLLESAQQLVKRYNPTLLDLNMGCPVKKITGNFEGCSLMKDMELATTLVRELAKSVPVPITVKHRLGWDDTSQNYLEFAQALEEAGAQMITLHARTRAQGYRPYARWECFGKLKQAVKIPVIANGDIVSGADAERIIRDFGVDGVMIGRGCQGAPWQLGHVDHYLRTGGELLPELTLQQRLEVAFAHTQGMADYKGETNGLRLMRGQLPWYVAGFEGASRWRERLTRINTLAELAQILNDILEKPHFFVDPERVLSQAG
jgi:tRNA-dihydrouridine synthase B